MEALAYSIVILENLMSTPRNFRMSQPMIMSYLPRSLAIWSYHLMSLSSWSSGIENSAFTLCWVVMHPPGVVHTVLAWLCFCGFKCFTHLEVTKLPEPPLSSRALTMTGLGLPFLVFKCKRQWVYDQRFSASFVWVGLRWDLQWEIIQGLGCDLDIGLNLCKRI